MNFKRVSALVLALAMTSTTAAFADERPEGWTPADGARDGLLISGNPFAGTYETVITINGETLESYDYTREIPNSWETETITVRLAALSAVPTGYVTLRAIALCAHGRAS